MLSIKGELGAGISGLWMASAEPSSINRVRRVKTLRTRKAMIRRLMVRKMARPRRMIVDDVVGGQIGVVTLLARVDGEGGGGRDDE